MAPDPIVLLSAMREEVVAELEGQYRERMQEAAAREAMAEDRVRVVTEESRESIKSLHVQVGLTSSVSSKY